MAVAFKHIFRRLAFIFRGNNNILTLTGERENLCDAHVELEMVMQAWYPISKTLAEKVAWEFAEQTGLDVVVINPGCVLGRMLQPRLNASVAVLLNLIQGLYIALLSLAS